MLFNIPELRKLAVFFKKKLREVHRKARGVEVEWTRLRFVHLVHLSSFTTRDYDLHKKLQPLSQAFSL